MADGRVQSIFDRLVSDHQLDDEDEEILKDYLLQYETPAKWFIHPDTERLPVYEAEELISEASKRYVELERNGYLLCNLPNFKFNPKSHLYHFIFDSKRLNNSKWTRTDRYGHVGGQTNVTARGYINTSTIPGFTESDPQDLNDNTKTFTRIAEDADNAEMLPAFSERQDFRRFYKEFYNAHIYHKIIGPIPYIILACPDLVDAKKGKIPAISTFDFRKIENKLITLGFDKIAGFGYAYVYYYCHCSSAGDHDEDASTNSFNANYGPNQKLWRIVTRKYAHKLRELTLKLKNVLPQHRSLADLCHLQHKGGYEKQSLIHPGLLTLYGIPYTVVVQCAGVGILTSSAAMHSVVNHGKGLSVAINIIVPINFLMNPITDLCTHTFENQDNENILVGMKRMALRDVAENPPLKTVPKPLELDDIPNEEVCGTRNYILELLDEFDQLDPTANKMGYKWAFYAVKRLMSLAGLDFDATTRIPHQISVKLNFTFSAKDLVDYNFPYPPANLDDFVSLPVLVAAYDNRGEIRYTSGKVNSIDGSDVCVQICGDYTTVKVNVLERKQICYVIGDFVPAVDELVVGENVVYFFDGVFRVGVFLGISENTDNALIIKANDSELRTKISRVRIIKPMWYASLCAAINRKMIPLCLPPNSKPRKSKKRPADGELNENAAKKIKCTDGQLIPFNIASDEIGRGFICPTCEKRFSAKQSLIEHFYSAHVQGFNALDCCGNQFSYPKSFIEHKKTKHGGYDPKDVWRPPTAKGNYILIKGNYE